MTAEVDVLVVTEGLEKELLDKDVDDGVERGAKGEMRRGINVPFENKFVVSGIGVGRGNGKVIKSPGNCRSNNYKLRRYGCILKTSGGTWRKTLRDDAWHYVREAKV